MPGNGGELKKKHGMEKISEVGGGFLEFLKVFVTFGGKPVSSQGLSFWKSLSVSLDEVPFALC